jgi:hypothetical protein
VSALQCVLIIGVALTTSSSCAEFFEVEAILEKSDFVEGETIVLKIRYTNKSAVPIRYVSHGNGLIAILSVIVESAGTKIKPFTPVDLGRPIVAESSVRTLAPNGSFGVSLSLLDFYRLPPGEYVLRTVTSADFNQFELTSGRAESKPVTLKVHKYKAAESLEVKTALGVVGILRTDGGDLYAFWRERDSEYRRVVSLNKKAPSFKGLIVSGDHNRAYVFVRNEGTGASLAIAELATGAVANLPATLTSGE